MKLARQVWLIVRAQEMMGNSLALRGGSVVLGWEEDRNAEDSASVEKPRRE